MHDCEDNDKDGLEINPHKKKSYQSVIYTVNTYPTY